MIKLPCKSWGKDSKIWWKGVTTQPPLQNLSTYIAGLYPKAIPKPKKNPAQPNKNHINMIQFQYPANQYAQKLSTKYIGSNHSDKLVVGNLY